MKPTNAQIWSGGLRLIHILTLAILLFSICVIVLGAEYVKQITTSPAQGYGIETHNDGHSWDGPGSIYVTKPIVYSCTMAFLSIIHSALNLTVPHFLILSPLYLILTSFVFVLGWFAQWGIWMDCEIVSIAVDRSRPTCPQKYLYSTRRQNFLSGIPSSEVNMRVIFGGVALVLYMALFVWSIAGQVRKNTLTRGTRLAKGVDEDESA